MAYLCNPLNIEYKYQIVEFMGKRGAFREAADPTLIIFHGEYYLFPSMTAGFLTSPNLVEWTFHPLEGVPVYDYAPDVLVVGDYLYFSASDKSKNCSFYRTKDPVNGEFEEITGSFPFWDPNLFQDEDGRLYFYWGCSNVTPIYGVELNPVDMQPLSDPIALIHGNPGQLGYERKGENHIEDGTAPYIEGAWMDKHNGTYYLQYASPGTEHNIYSDAVYISDKPLGPFRLADNNPFSYKPGGFMPGAGHGSTQGDHYGNLWHISTMRISMSHLFERRIGLWPAGFDRDGELFCNQRFGDWPYRLEQRRMDPWSSPEWMLLSYNKPAAASSSEQGYEPSKAADENVQTWWRAGSSQPGEWLELDLKQECSVHAVQINFADDRLQVDLPAGAVLQKNRYIVRERFFTRWLLEGSRDGEEYFVIEDKTEAATDLPHDLIVREEGITARFIRCTVLELPFGQQACISGFRVFGKGTGELPEQTDGVVTVLENKLDLHVRWNGNKATGYNVLWGYAADKLYHSHMVFGGNDVMIGALITDQPVYVRVDAFNEMGITEGRIHRAV
ncbi:family 43 glycosylhydrolase [Paenibacillus sp. DMB5]|uniref:family 43 glycosylhydrolase n=1 Tax=Paenibacillus sp. DMB5 TaxID=1780103 RepID=UPI00076D839E|nr:family 43 glycosylhydrolase [Paenibacillus sp. DMB5]KUP23516.1 1,4-beta-xylanase [Paenibacillus sp. DMB5]